MRRSLGFFGLISTLLLWLTPAVAQDLADLPSGGALKVASVVDGDTVVLDDGRQVRLVGIQAPKLALGRANFTPWPLAEEAKAALEQLIAGETVELRLPPQAMDRHGRVLAHLVRQSDGAWVQGEMLSRGMARVYTFADNRNLAALMLSLEQQARAAKRGMWAIADYAVRSSEDLRLDPETFQIVEGRVLDAVHIKDRVYLNFGPDWRTDFTIKVTKRDIKLFDTQGINLLNMTGKAIRVRGWVKAENGPMIELDHPERLEVLEP